MDWLKELLGFSLPSIWGWVVGAVVALSVPLGTYFKGKKDQRIKSDLKTREELAKKDKEILNVVRETQRNLDRLDPDAIIDRLRRNDGDWSRM